MLFLPLLSLLGLFQPPNAPETPPVRGELVPSITVVGTGKVTARPNQAEVRIGVVTEAHSAARALEENNAAMERLLQTLSARGIADKDVQTSQFTVSPQYRYDREGGEPPKITGYQVTNQVRVTVRQLATLGGLLDKVVSEGANQVQGIRFAVAEEGRYLDRARRQALAEARRKAELYAQEAGVKRGRVLLIREQAADAPTPPFFGFAAQERAAAVPVAPGELEFTAEVTVTYGIQ